MGSQEIILYTGLPLQSTWAKRWGLDTIVDSGIKLTHWDISNKYYNKVNIKEFFSGSNSYSYQISNYEQINDYNSLELLVKKLNPEINIDCIENNNQSRKLIDKEFSGTKTFSNIEDVVDKYDLIFAIQVFEHFIETLQELQKIERISHKRSKLYFLFQNYDDWNQKTLPKRNLIKYNKFMFHKAHPYYYTIDNFSRLISMSNYKIDEITTFQDYSITNYMNWYINGEPNKNIYEATHVEKNLMDLNKEFVHIVEQRDNGNNISALLKIT